MSDEQADEAFAARRAADQAFLGLEPGADGRASFRLADGLVRHDGRLFGGTAVAAAIALAELATGRPALWATVQFVSGAAVLGDRIDCRVEELARGGRTSQVRVSAHVGDQELFCALGATSEPKAAALAGTFATFPDVPPPDECEQYRFPIPPAMRVTPASIEQRMEMRVVRDAGQRRAASGLRYWVRSPGRRVTPALLGFLADMIPSAVVHALGHMGGGTSLDNTLRLGHPADTEWVLLELEPHVARGGTGTGTGLLWAPDGTLLAVASQSASLLVLD